MFALCCIGGSLPLLLLRAQQARELASRPRTLLIVQGAWRSLGRVVDSILEHFIAVNEPCDVVLSLDALKQEGEEGEEGMTQRVLAKLQPHLVGVLFPPNITWKRAGGIEFSQVARALSGVDLTPYAYIAKTRTDLALMHPFDFQTAQGIGPRFPPAFARFIKDLRVHAARRKPPVAITPCGVLEAWIAAAGMTVYISPGVFQLRSHPMMYSPVTHADVTRALSADIAAECVAAWGGGEDEGEEHDCAGWAFLKDVDAVRPILARLFRKHHIMVLAGNTWLNWGTAADFLRVYKLLGQGGMDLRTLPTWANLPPPWESLSEPLWEGRSTTESVLRIAHVLSNVSIVGLNNVASMQLSFDGRKLPLHCLEFSDFRIRSDTLAAGVFILRPRPGGDVCAI